VAHSQPFENLVERDVKGWCEVEVEEEATCNEVGVASLVNFRSKVRDVSRLETTPRTANQPTQQACSPKNPIDSHCMESLLEQSRVERRHRVYRELILSRQETVAEKLQKETKKTNMKMQNVSVGKVCWLSVAQ
jgi:hypothetical protein